MQIRLARQEDHSAIFDLVDTAFQTAKVADGDEPEFVDILRSRPTYRPALELVAEDADGGLAGYVMLSEIRPILRDGEPVPTLMVEPLCVRLQAREHGLGAQLLKEGLDRARELGYTCAFLMGDIHYYSRFGFRCVTDYGLHSDCHAEDSYVLGCPLVPDALEGVSGGIDLD